MSPGHVSLVGGTTLPFSIALPGRLVNCDAKARIPGVSMPGLALDTYAGRLAADALLETAWGAALGGAGHHSVAPFGVPPGAPAAPSAALRMERIRRTSSGRKTSTAKTASAMVIFCTRFCPPSSASRPA